MEGGGFTEDERRGLESARDGSRVGVDGMKEGEKVGRGGGALRRERG